MRRPVRDDASRNDGGSGVFDTDSLLPRRAPLLHLFLTDDKWDDGAPRVAGTILLFAEGGRYKACLNDRDGGRSVFVSGDSVEAILDALEAGLADDNLEWRAKAPSGGKGRK